MFRNTQDRWAQWLLHRRFGGDPQRGQAMLETLSIWRDQVLQHATLTQGETVLDVGCGDGLIAFGALDRVGEQGLLKPGGRLSIFEPINRFCYPEPPHLFQGYDVTPIQEIVGKVRAVFERIHEPESSPLLNFDERDLLTYAERAGFAEIHLDLQASIKQPKPLDPHDGTARTTWETVLKSSGNPLSPTLEEAMAQALSAQEAEQFTSYLRPLVETTQGHERQALAYLWALKR